METLVLIAFCMTALAIPMITFLPVFAKDVFHKNELTYTLFLVASGLELHHRSAHRGMVGQYSQQRPGRACDADGIRSMYHGFFDVAFGRRKLRSALHVRICDDVRFRDDFLTRTDHYTQRHAGTGHERL